MKNLKISLFRSGEYSPEKIEVFDFEDVKSKELALECAKTILDYFYTCNSVDRVIVDYNNKRIMIFNEKHTDFVTKHTFNTFCTDDLSPERSKFLNLFIKSQELIIKCKKLAFDRVINDLFEMEEKFKNDMLEKLTTFFLNSSY